MEPDILLIFVLFYVFGFIYFLSVHHLDIVYDWPILYDKFVWYL